MLASAASEASSSSQICQQEFDVRRQRNQLPAKDSVAETMNPIDVTTHRVTSDTFAETLCKRFVFYFICNNHN